MPRPDRLWLVLFAGVLAVAVGGCKSQPKAKLGPSEAPVYSVRDPDSVRRQVRLQDLLALAARDMQVGNLDAAERKAREALKLAPESPDALVLLAGIDERRGRTQQAGESFRRAAEQAPQRGDILNNYGAWLCQQGRPAESLVWFDRALQAPGYATPAESQANAGGLCAGCRPVRTCRARPACGAGDAARKPGRAGGDGPAQLPPGPLHGGPGLRRT